MEFNQIESFLSVVKYKSFSKAAKDLYLTQPTISNNIQALEKELNTTLLNRTSKTISLTDSGKLFYKYALELINVRDRAKFEIKDKQENIQGMIDVSTSSIPALYILPYIIRDFRKAYPNISFNISQKNSRDIITDIIDGNITFGIVGAKIPSRILEYMHFYEDELVLALPNTDRYSSLACEDLNIDFIFSQDFLFRKEGSGTRIFIESSLADLNISPDDLNIRAILDSNQMIKKMIELGQGVSFVSELSIRNEIKAGLIKACKIKGLNLKRKFYFVYSKYMTLPTNVETFKDFIMNIGDENFCSF